MEVPTETLTVTLTERDKHALKVIAATQGRTMREVVRQLIRQAAAAPRGDEEARAERFA